MQQIFGLDGDVAYDEQSGRTVRASERVAAERWAEMYHTPVGILLLALDETSSVSNLREEEGQRRPSCNSLRMRPRRSGACAPSGRRRHWCSRARGEPIGSVRI